MGILGIYLCKFHANYLYVKFSFSALNEKEYSWIICYVLTVIRILLRFYWYEGIFGFIAWWDKLPSMSIVYIYEIIV